MDIRQMTSSQVRAARRLAIVLTSTPRLRAQFFAHPSKLGKQLPAAKYWDYGIDPRLLPWHPVEHLRQRHEKRARLAQHTFEDIATRIDSGELSSTVNTDAVFEEFFQPIVRLSQRSFDLIVILSVIAFLVGCGLVVFGVIIAFYPPAGVNSTVLASVFGGTGAVSALGAVYTMATQGITTASAEHANLRVVLTAFATQLGQLRAIAEDKPASQRRTLLEWDPLKAATSINEAIEKATSEAIVWLRMGEEKELANAREAAPS